MSEVRGREAAQHNERFGSEASQLANEIEHGTDLEEPMERHEQQARGRRRQQFGKTEMRVMLIFDTEVDKRRRGARMVEDEVGEGGQAKGHDHDLASLPVPTRTMDDEGRGRGHGRQAWGLGCREARKGGSKSSGNGIMAQERRP